METEKKSRRFNVLVNLQVFVESKSLIFRRSLLTKSSTITRQRELRPDEIKLGERKLVSPRCEWVFLGRSV